MPPDQVSSTAFSGPGLGVSTVASLRQRWLKPVNGVTARSVPRYRQRTHEV